MYLDFNLPQTKKIIVWMDQHNILYIDIISNNHLDKPPFPSYCLQIQCSMYRVLFLKLRKHILISRTQVVLSQVAFVWLIATLVFYHICVPFPPLVSPYLEDRCSQFFPSQLMCKSRNPYASPVRKIPFIKMHSFAYL